MGMGAVSCGCECGVAVVVGSVSSPAYYICKEDSDLRTKGTGEEEHKRVAREDGAALELIKHRVAVQHRRQPRGEKSTHMSDA